MMASLGSTGRGRGVTRADNDIGLGRGRGRGVIAAPELANNMSSLEISANTNGYKEDAKLAFSRVTSKPGNVEEVVDTLTSWLTLAEENPTRTEEVVAVVCESMGHPEYGNKIRETTLGKIFKMFQDCSNNKISSESKLISYFSLTGYFYLIQRENSKRLDFYVKPLILYLKEIIKRQLNAELIKRVIKQITINGIALNAHSEGQVELELIYKSIRELMCSQSIDNELRPYILFLCDIQSAQFGPVPKSSFKFYSQYFSPTELNAYKPLEIDLKLYKQK